MKNKNNRVNADQGSASSQVDELNRVPTQEELRKVLEAKLEPDQIEKYLKRDLVGAIRCLEAIYKDQNLLKMVAQWFAGRMDNLAQQEANKSQTELFPKPKAQA